MESTTCILTMSCVASTGPALVWRIKNFGDQSAFTSELNNIIILGSVSQLGWDLLHTRCLLSQSTMFFKIHQQLVDISFQAFITPASYISRNDHSLKLTVPVATIDPYKFYFYPRAIRIWNCLPLQALTPAVFQEAALPAIRRMKPPIGDRML